MKEWIRKQLGTPHETILQIMRKISSAGIGIALIVEEKNKLIGYVTDSDIQRAILRDVNLEAPVAEIMVRKPVTFPKGLSRQDYIRLLREKRVNRAPIVDENGIVDDIALYWKLQEEALQEKEIPLDFSVPSRQEQ